ASAACLISTSNFELCASPSRTFATGSAATFANGLSPPGALSFGDGLPLSGAAALWRSSPAADEQPACNAIPAASKADITVRPNFCNSLQPPIDDNDFQFHYTGDGQSGLYTKLPCSHGHNLHDSRQIDCFLSGDLIEY